MVRLVREDKEVPRALLWNQGPASRTAVPTTRVHREKNDTDWCSTVLVKRAAPVAGDMSIEEVLQFKYSSGQMQTCPRLH